MKKKLLPALLITTLLMGCSDTIFTLPSDVTVASAKAIIPPEGIKISAYRANENGYRMFSSNEITVTSETPDISVSYDGITFNMKDKLTISDDWTYIHSKVHFKGDGTPVTFTLLNKGDKFVCASDYSEAKLKITDSPYNGCIT